MKGFPASTWTTSISGLEEISLLISQFCAFSGYVLLIVSLMASSRNTPVPYICSMSFLGALPLRKPGTLILPLCLRYTLSIALSNSSALTSMVSFAILFSSFSTVTLIEYYPPVWFTQLQCIISQHLLNFQHGKLLICRFFRKFPRIPSWKRQVPASVHPEAVSSTSSRRLWRAC